MTPTQVVQPTPAVLSRRLGLSAARVQGSVVETGGLVATVSSGGSDTEKGYETQQRWPQLVG